MTEFWQRKIRTYFKLLDFDKDGSVTQKDFELMAEQFCKAEKADAKRSEAIRKLIIDIFRVYATGSLDRVLKGDEVLTEDVLIESMKTMRNNPDFPIVLKSIIHGLFGVMDTNKDGFVQDEEHRKFFENLGFPDTSFTKTAFQAIDTNGDGTLSFEEFAAGHLEFLWSEDENNPYTLFFGALVSP